MSVEKVIVIRVETVQAQQEVDRLNDSLDKTDDKANDAGKGIDSIETSTKKLGDTAETTSKKVKGLTTAMAASIIGAIVVAISFLIRHWDTLESIASDYADELERINEESERLEGISKILSAQLRTLAAQKKLRELQGEGVDDLIVKENELLDAAILNTAEQIKQAKINIIALENKALEVTLAEKLIGFLKGAGKIPIIPIMTKEESEAIRNAKVDLANLETSIASFATKKLSLLPKPPEDPRDAVNPITGVSSNTLYENLINDGVAISEFSGLLAAQRKLNLDLDKENSDAKIELAEKEAEAKRLILQAVSSGLASLSDIVGRNTAEGKALAIASSLINTYQGITLALASFPGPVGIAFAIATGLAGFAAVKQIAQVEVPGGYGGSSSVGRAALPSPSFNVVGQSNTNQLNETLAANNVEPVKAYVVGSEVSTQQGLDRQISLNASLG